MTNEQEIKKLLPDLFDHACGNLEFLKTLKNSAVRYQMYELGARIRDMEKSLEIKTDEKKLKTVTINEMYLVVTKHAGIEPAALDKMTLEDIKHLYLAACK